MLLHVSFEALVSCLVQLLKASELIYFGAYLACSSFRLHPDRRGYACFFGLVLVVGLDAGERAAVFYHWVTRKFAP